MDQLPFNNQLDFSTPGDMVWSWGPLNLVVDRSVSSNLPAFK